MTFFQSELVPLEPIFTLLYPRDFCNDCSQNTTDNWSQDKDPNLLKSRTTNKRAGAKLRAGLTESPVMFKPTRIIKVKLKPITRPKDLAITFGS